MKKSYQKLIIFDTIIVILLILNSFILNILGNYYYMSAFLILLLIGFKLIFGFEKGNYRYVKDIIVNMTIIYLTSFIIYYLFGLLIGFYRTDNYLNLYGLKTFIVPYILMITIREYLRVQMLNKTDKSKGLTIVTCIIFILFELSAKITFNSINSNYQIFMLWALTILPIISNNIVCTYIAKKVGYKPNIFWLLIAELYLVILPIAPNVGSYILALIEFLFPYIIMYNVYSFFEKRKKNIPLSYTKKRKYIGIPALAIIVFILAYFISGHFKYYAIAVATGSMHPQIDVGDVVIANQYRDYKDLKIGEVIAYKYSNIIVVHRICDIVIIGDDYYFYTQGDANENKDNYIIYPNMIIGSVKTKIPYIGLPTVWLNQLFE